MRKLATCSPRAIFQSLEPRRLFSMPGDFNADGVVNSTDFNVLSVHFGKQASASTGDANGDGVCNTLDLNLLAANFGKTEVPGSTVKPDASNTGPTGTLTNRGGFTASTANAIYENLNITGQVNVTAENVTFRNCRINANGSGNAIKIQGVDGTRIEDCELFNASGTGILFAGGSFTATRLDIHDMGSDALQGWCNTGAVSSLTDSWIHKITLSPGAHGDGVQIMGGQHFVFKGNNFDVPVDQPDGSKSNAAFFIHSDGILNDVLIEGNWLNGGNYTVFVGSSSNIRVINNVFGDGYRFGIRSGDIAVWSGNTNEIGESV